MISRMPFTPTRLLRTTPILVGSAVLALAACGTGNSGTAASRTAASSDAAPTAPVADALTLRDAFSGGLAPTSSGWSDAAKPSGMRWSATRTGRLGATSTDDGDTGLLVIGRPKWTDSSMAIDLRVERRGEAGVVVRHSASGDYRLTWDGAAGKLALTRWGADGQREQLATHDLALAAGTWHRLELRAVGNQLGGFVDGELVVSATDDAHGSGVAGIALRQAAGATTYLDEAEARATVDSFTIAVLPDTQYYAKGAAKGNRPDTFGKQTAWLAANRGREDIAFVLHAGDVVDGICSTKQWAIASRAMRTLEGRLGYAITPGNHDILDYDSCPAPGGLRGSRERVDTAAFLRTFPVQRLRDASPTTWAGASPPKSSGTSLHRFEAAGARMSVVTLPFGPTASQLTWAARVAKAESAKGRTSALLTHDFLDSDGRLRGTHADHTQLPELPGQLRGVEIWNRLVAPTRDLRLVFSGHIYRCALRPASRCDDVGAVARRVTDNRHGQPVVQLMADYQIMPSGGGGFLRLVRIFPSEDRIEVRTYSPSSRSFLRDASNAFTLRDLELR
ncbi:MAG: YvnB [Thermoleophilia bacterium]|nr:YvnB [Thermoleophilia bacterium]